MFNYESLQQVHSNNRIHQLLFSSVLSALHFSLIRLCKQEGFYQTLSFSERSSFMNGGSQVVTGLRWIV
jgi:hypothetical protein